MGGWLGSALLGSLYSPLKLLNSARIRPIFFADLALVLFPVLLCNKQFQRLRDSRGGLEGVWTMVCDWQAVLAAARSVPSGSASPSLCHSIFPSPGRQDTGRRRQASGPSQAAGDQPALPASLGGPARLGGPGSPGHRRWHSPLREERARTSPQALRPAGLGN